MIEFSVVTAGYGGAAPVLERCTFRVEAGERVALMGPSGSGKTTVLRLISGRLQPRRGTVRVGAKKISYMFQEPRLLPWLSAEDNVNLVLSDGPDTLEAARQALEAVGLGAAAKKYPAELSGGMRQRVSLARALAYGGDLFLLDEPLSALDADKAEELLHLLERHMEGRTLLFVTHSLSQARRLSSRICTMDGRGGIVPLEDV